MKRLTELRDRLLFPADMPVASPVPLQADAKDIATKHTSTREVAETTLTETYYEKTETTVTVRYTEHP